MSHAVLAQLCLLAPLVAFFVAIVLGLYQVANRSGLFPEIESHELYFASVSTHGVLMGFVLTTFFIMGFGYYTATSTLKRPLWNKPLAWFAFYLALGGTVRRRVGPGEGGLEAGGQQGKQPGRQYRGQVMPTDPCALRS